MTSISTFFVLFWGTYDIIFPLTRHFARALICFSLQNDGPLKVTKADYRLVWCPLLLFASSILVIRPHVLIRKEKLTLSEARCDSS